MTEDCPFCKLDRPPLEETDYMQLIESKFGVSEVHYLIIPKRHIESPSQLDMDEWVDMYRLLGKAHTMFSKGFNDFNVGWNDGKYAGQTVMHAHIHIIGRKKGDVEDPRGGIRNVIPSKGNYLK